LQAAAKSLGKSLINSLKAVLGIASPSKIFDALGRFTAEGFDDGFTKRFKEFKGDAIAQIRQFTAQLRAELAKVAPMGGGGGASSGAAWRQFLQDQAARPRPQGSRAYTAPIGPLPMGSQEPWAAEGGGYTPRLTSNTYQRPAQLPSEGMMGPASPRGSMGQFPMAGMAYPSSPLGVITPQSSMFGGGGGGGGGRGGFNFPAMPAPVNMPGLGTAKQLGDEFAFAAKQVLLFGTTYKALAFLTSFPAQVGEAVAQLQSFRNTLNAITPSAQEAAASSAFIAQVVEKYTSHWNRLVVALRSFTLRWRLRDLVAKKFAICSLA